MPDFASGWPFAGGFSIGRSIWNYKIFNRLTLKFSHMARDLLEFSLKKPESGTDSTETR
jgi:hypothetical protein